ncbi:MAG: hypothetical protein ACO1TE_24025 [Prosthecobacter sp.]
MNTLSPNLFFRSFRLKKGLLAAFFSLAACWCGPAYADPVKPQAYFTAPGSWKVDKSFIDDSPRHPDTRYMVAEFQDDGQPWLKEQIAGLEREIGSFNPKTILLYTHGWHNDASTRSQKKGGDMRDLDTLLQSLHTARGVRIMAIYVGWRGEETTDFIGRWKTLDSRREVARDIGKSRPFQQFLARVARAGHGVNANMVFAGHSLGAALMENAATQLICSSRPENDLPHLFLLANSAELSYLSKANIAAINQHDSVRKRLQGTRLLAPRVIAATSLGDSADEDINPLNSLLLRGRWGDKTIGFDKEALTHTVAQVTRKGVLVKTPEDYLPEIRRSLQPRLDPTFWAPNKNHSRIHLHRITPNANRAQAAGFWNVQIPKSLSTSHNDVYNPRILASGLSWFQIAHPALTLLPDNLPELLKSLRDELRKSLVSEAAWEARREMRLQLVNGAALRLPFNKLTLKMLLDELKEPEEMPKSAANQKLRYRYRTNLYSILKYAQGSEDGWTAVELGLLRAMLGATGTQPADDNMESQRNALVAAGTSNKDANLDAFLRYLKSQQIWTP